VVRSDLRYAEPVAGDMPDDRPAVVASSAKVIRDSARRLAGVVSVSLRARTVDESMWSAVGPDKPVDPTRIFLRDDQGRLVTRLSSADRFVTANDTVRVAPTNPPPAVALDLASPLLRTVSLGAEHPFSVRVAGERYMVTLHELAQSHHWIVCVLVPEDYYVHELRVLRNRFLVAYFVVSALVLCGGILTLRAVRRGLGTVLDATTRMRQFDFSPSRGQTPFRDIQQVRDGIERAKTVASALGEYVPIGLVRELYESNREPELGGTLREATVMSRPSVLGAPEPGSPRARRGHVGMPDRREGVQSHPLLILTRAAIGERMRYASRDRSSCRNALCTSRAMHRRRATAAMFAPRPTAVMASSTGASSRDAGSATHRATGTRATPTARHTAREGRRMMPLGMATRLASAFALP
jgi:hypothetical protein